MAVASDAWLRESWQEPYVAVSNRGHVFVPYIARMYQRYELVVGYRHRWMVV